MDEKMFDSIQGFFINADSQEAKGVFSDIYAKYMEHCKSNYNLDETLANNLINNLFGGWENVCTHCNFNIKAALSNHLSNLYHIRLPGVNNANQSATSANVNTNGSNNNNTNNNATSKGNTNTNSMARMTRITNVSSGMNADTLYRIQFLATIKYTIDPDMLPISVSPLVSMQNLLILKPRMGVGKIVSALLQYSMQANNNEGNFETSLQRFCDNYPIVTTIKQTHFKQLKAFLKMLQKEFIIDFKDSGSGDTLLTKINFDYLENECQLLNEYNGKDFFDPKAKQYENWTNKLRQQFVAKKFENAGISGSGNSNQPSGGGADDEKMIGATTGKGRITIDIKYRVKCVCVWSLIVIDWFNSVIFSLFCYFCF